MITVDMYIHKMEKEATGNLDKRLISDYYKNQLIDFYRRFEESSLLPDLIGKSVEANEEQFSNIYYIINELSNKLSIKTPKVYIYESFFYDVNAEGYDEPWIQISSKTLEDFTESELKFSIGRQLCHIKENHIKYEILCEQFSKALGIVGQIGGSLVSPIPGMAVVSGEALEIYSSAFKLRACQWSRISEYTADNCGYLLCRDIDASISSIKKQILNSNKLANEMKLKSFIKQADHINSMESPISVYSILDEQIPYGPFRIKELLKFASSNNTKKCIRNTESSARYLEN